MTPTQKRFLSVVILLLGVYLSFTFSTYFSLLSIALIFVERYYILLTIGIIVFVLRVDQHIERYESHKDLLGKEFVGEIEPRRLFSKGRKAFCYSDSLNHMIYVESPIPLSLFETYVAKGTFVLPKMQLNPSEFNQREFAFQSSVFLQLKVDSIAFKAEKETLKAGLYKHIDAETRRLSGTFRGVLYAGLLGEKLHLPQEDRTLFAVSGLSHFFALSGLHVGLLVFVVWSILSQCTRQFWVRYSSILIFLTLYIFLVGLKPPIFRASIMAALFLWGRYQFKFMNSFHILFTTAFINIVIFPFDIFQLSFWLSYMALFAILYGLKRFDRLALTYDVERKSKRIKIAQYIVVVLLPYLGTMPLIFLLFSEVSLASTVNNIVLMIPLSFLLYGMMFYLLCSFASSAAAEHIGFFLDRCLELMKRFLAETQAIPPLENRGNFLELIGVFILVLIVFHFRHLPIRNSLAALGILVFFAVSVKWYVGENWLHVRVFDLGQAQAILVSYGEWHALYDAGKETRKRLWKKNELAPILKRVGVDTVDIVLISHKDFDHYGNLAGLQFRQVENHPAEIDSIFPSQINRRNLSLFHLPERRHFRGKNSSSLVYKGVFGNFSFLLTGDIEAPRENELVSYASDFLKSDVLSVAHHGSNSSSTPAFLNAALPSLAVVSVGEKNRYGHPDADVMARLKKAAVWRTDRDSYLHIVSNGKDFWRVPPAVERVFF